MGAAIAPLADLIANLTRENRELAETATLWQERARYLGEQLRALEAGPITETDEEAPQDANMAPVRDDPPAPVSTHCWSG